VSRSSGIFKADEIELSDTFRPKTVAADLLLRLRRPVLLADGGDSSGEGL